MAPYLAQGALLACPTDDGVPMIEHTVYAWRSANPSQALKWWLKKLASPTLRASLLGDK